jgi:hypothetical protein
MTRAIRIDLNNIHIPFLYLSRINIRGDIAFNNPNFEVPGQVFN